MKKLLSFVTVAAGLTSLVCLSGCGNKTVQGDLVIKFENKGYGDSWIKAMAARYEALHPGIKVQIKNVTEINFENDFSVGSKSGIDLYICGNPGYGTLLAKGSTLIHGKNVCFEDLTDLYTTPNPYDNGTTTVAEKLEANGLLKYSEYHYSNKKDYKYYMMPYAAGASGFLVNSALVKDTINTTDELYSYLQRGATEIGGPAVRIAWSREGIDYFEYVMNTWIAQYSGKNRFNAIANICEDEQWGDWTYSVAENNGILESFKVAEKIIHYQNVVGRPGIWSYSNFNEANTAFTRGEAGIMPCGNWFASELLKRSGSAIDVFSTPIKFLKTPIISSIIDVLPDKTVTDDAMLSAVITAIDNGQTSYVNVSENDFNYLVEARKLYYSAGFNQQMYIPTSALHTDRAKDFMLFIASEEGSDIFRNNTFTTSPYSTKKYSGRTCNFLSSFEDVTFGGNPLFEAEYQSKWAGFSSIGRYNDQSMNSCASYLATNAQSTAKQIYDLCYNALKIKVEANI